MFIKNAELLACEPARKRAHVSVGQSVCSVRELQNMTQVQLAGLSGISLAALQAIENDHSPLDVEQAKMLARTLRVHPAVLLFPGWEIEESAALDSSHLKMS